MEEMMKLQSTCGSNRVHQPAALAMHKDSHVISKFKPKIRIVHIFAPEIIKTDVANFRELVQRLTGKPSSDGKICKKQKARKSSELVSSSSRSSSGSNKKYFCKQQPKMTGSSSTDGFQSSGPSSGTNYGYGDGIKEEDEEVLWGGENSSVNNFFGGFTDNFDGFIQGLEFPFLPLNSTHHHMEMFDEENYLT
ncbi:VQ [Macleaya cordata]|uniref:VQ n=1 Tax=Macleaya cordata TaxID=56857 RepID=A0A200QRG1_MACCD|nr:VQ [Macleaya cordata]